MKVVQSNQSLFDIASAHCGSPLAAFQLAILNGISITEELTPGSKIEIPARPINADVIDYYKSKKHEPATAILEDGTPTAGGIGNMTIGIDFIVG